MPPRDEKVPVIVMRTGRQAVQAVTRRVGGKRTAALNPIHGRDKIVRFFEGVARGGLLQAAVHQVQVNGLPGFVMVDRDGNIDTIATIDIRDGHIAAIYAVRNPDKLAHVSLSSLRGGASVQ